MGMLGHKGAETVDAGTYWDFETDAKVRLNQRGLLPGTPSQSYYKAPPMLILAAAIAAYLIMYVLPKYSVCAICLADQKVCRLSVMTLLHRSRSGMTMPITRKTTNAYRRVTYPGIRNSGIVHERGRA